MIALLCFILNVLALPFKSKSRLEAENAALLLWAALWEIYKSQRSQMIIKHDAATPRIDPAAWIAPNAVICGNVTIGPDCRVMFGAQVIAEGGSIGIGRECIIMENAVLRSSARHSLSISNTCLIGPNAHVVGCTLEDEVFIATGAAVFHAARLGKGSEVRINGVVHLKTRLAAGEIPLPC